MKPVIALDFDGVICDSLEECLVTAYNAYHQLKGSGRWANSPADIEPELADSFRNLRHFARNAPELLIVMSWCITESRALDQIQYDSLVSSYASRMPAFESIFFESRHILSSADLDRWLGLHSMYPEFRDGWEEVKGRFPIHIVTTKDLVSIQYFNQHWELGVPEKNLWTKECALSKGGIVRCIADDSGRPIQEVFFVDDHPHHVRDVATTGASCFWAAWGFLGVQGSGPVEEEGKVFTKISRLADLKPYLQF